MKALRKNFDWEEFKRRAARAAERVLMLDYDGTLAPFAVERDRAFPYPGVMEILGDIIERNCTRLVLITGRGIEDIIPLLGLKKLPEIWGSHGAERMSGEGGYTKVELRSEVKEALSRIEFIADMENLAPPIEKKPSSIAFHWRGLSEVKAAQIRKTVLVEIKPVAENAGMELKDFDGGVEVRIPGIDKGAVVREILSGMSRDALAVYLGDDLTDEDAFRAIRGRGIGVLVRNELRETEADLWLKPPDELIAFLKEWGEICEHNGVGAGLR